MMDCHAEETLFAQAAKYTGERIAAILDKVPPSVQRRTQEIRLRLGGYVTLSCPGQDLFIQLDGGTSRLPSPAMLRCTKSDMTRSFMLCCENSVHTFQHEICMGYITLAGGHRAGLCGSAVRSEGSITNLRDISSISIRIARQIREAAREIMPELIRDGRILSTLVVSAPGAGKTTLLRDIARRISNGDATGKPVRTAIIDERGEIAASRYGIPQNDVGVLSDVFDLYPKHIGMMHAIRSMSPGVLICDEIGDAEDARAILSCFHAGVPMILSAHAGSRKELLKREHIMYIIEKGVIEKILFLDALPKPGTLSGIYTPDLLRQEMVSADGNGTLSG